MPLHAAAGATSKDGANPPLKLSQSVDFSPRPSHPESSRRPFTFGGAVAMGAPRSEPMSTWGTRSGWIPGQEAPLRGQKCSPREVKPWAGTHFTVTVPKA